MRKEIKGMQGNRSNEMGRRNVDSLCSTRSAVDFMSD